MVWYVYIAVCADASLYTGITTSVQRREQEHNRCPRKGAKSLRGKRPVRVIHVESYPSRSVASQREYEIQQLPRAKKLLLIGDSLHAANGLSPAVGDTADLRK